MRAERSDKAPNVLWPLRILALLSMVAPALLLGYAIWVNHRAIVHQSGERIERALDVVEEHALKAFQTIDRTISETNEVLRDLTDEQIRADEPRLQQRLRRTQQELPQIQAIWVFDRHGHPLVTSSFAPVPRDLNNSDRDYFRAQAEADVGPFIGDIITARIGGLRFFVFSRRRPSADGAFNGVVAIAVYPSHFQDFYARIARGVADLLALTRPDGAFLARHPFRADQPSRLTPQSGFVQAIQTNPDAGEFEVVSQIDGIARRVAYRKVPGYPVYIDAGIEVAAIWRELRRIMTGHLIFGFPATLLLIGLSVYALRRTEAFHAEVGRRERAENALKQAQRLEAIGQLTGGVAHDFNNLLMVVNGNVERLRRYSLDERQKRSLDAIETAAQRGANLTRQLLSFSRQQAHEPTVLDLRERLSELEDMLRSSLRGDIAIDVKVPESLWPIRVDGSEFELAVLNIAVNARDAMVAGGQLTVAAQNVSLAAPAAIGLTGDFVALSLSDTGSGIPPDILSRVFEPFFTTKGVGKGTGLGLSQVYGFARQSGGTVTIASEPGRGTTITLYLPRTTEAAPAEAARKDDGPRRAGSGHILLVEDNAEVAEVTKANLEELGYRVTHAADVQTALERLAAEGFDLVLSDIVMPGQASGIDLARTMRERYPRTPVVLATGYSNAVQDAAEEGFTILRKPYDLATLSETVRKAIVRRRMRVIA